MFLEASVTQVGPVEPKRFVEVLRRELVITTPYYVPDESIQRALCASAYRGVDTRIVFPAQNDSRVVAAASRSQYAELLAAGVKIYEFPDGLLHTKSLTMDGEVTLIGSANLDATASFWENEANVVVQNAEFASKVEAELQALIDGSVALDPDSEYWKRERAQRAVVGTLWPGSFYS